MKNVNTFKRLGAAVLILAMTTATSMVAFAGTDDMAKGKEDSTPAVALTDSMEAIRATEVTASIEAIPSKEITASIETVYAVNIDEGTKKMTKIIVE